MFVTQEALLALAGEVGFDRAAVVDTADIAFEPAFRRYCADNLCGKYGANYTCPPDCGDTEKMRRSVQSYRRALVLQSKWEIDAADSRGIRDAKARHNRWTRELIDRCGGGGLMVGASGCNLCEPCLRTEGKPCRFPALRFSCMSAYCIHVAKLAQLCGMDYYSPEAVRLFSMYCFDDFPM